VRRLWSSQPSVLILILINALGAKPTATLVTMKAKHFVVAERPQLATIRKHPEVAVAEYQQQLSSMQLTMQAIQQAYLGTRERAVVVLEGWDAAGKGGIVRRLGWALDPRSFKVLSGRRAGVAREG
jgi:polyphosphate kinase 2 (PPK2 family)